MSIGKEYLLDNYKLEQVLQESGYSRTELVLHQGTPFIRKTIAGTGLVYKQLKGIKHPGLPHIFYVVEEAGKSYIIEEYISGRTLQECLEQGIEITKDNQVKIALQLCQSLKLLHSKGLLHRDIKPSNIIVMHDLQQVKLIDFGIARGFNKNTVQDTCIMGTPGYAPPEQYGFKDTDQRSDIYALGKTLLEMVEHNPNPDLQKLLQPCIAFDPEQRYQSAAELEKVLRGKPYPAYLKYLVGLMVAGSMGLGLYNGAVQQPESKAVVSEIPKATIKESATKEAAATKESFAAEPQLAENSKNKDNKLKSNEKMAAEKKPSATVPNTADEVALMDAVKLKQVGTRWYFAKASLKKVNEKEAIYQLKGVKDQGPTITIENISDHIAVNPKVELELYSFGMKGQDFVWQTDASHKEVVKFSRLDALGVARRLSIQLEGAIEPKTKYTFQALTQVKDFYMYYKGDHGTVLGGIRCKHMVYENIGYEFVLK